MTHADTAERKPGLITRSRARLLLTLYTVALALIALWPVPVDGGAGSVLRTITRIFPALTYARIEFSANILLFVPLGVLLMLILRRRYLIVPIAIAVTVGIECAQALLLDKRTPSVLDVIANTAGACIGMLLVAVIESRRARATALPGRAGAGARRGTFVPPAGGRDAASLRSRPALLFSAGLATTAATLTRAIRSLRGGSDTADSHDDGRVSPASAGAEVSGSGTAARMSARADSALIASEDDEGVLAAPVGAAVAALSVSERTHGGSVPVVPRVAGAPVAARPAGSRPPLPREVGSAPPVGRVVDAAPPVGGSAPTVDRVVGSAPPVGVVDAALPRAVHSPSASEGVDASSNDASPSPVGAAMTARAVSQRTHGGSVPVVPRTHGASVPAVPRDVGSLVTPPPASSPRTVVSPPPLPRTVDSSPRTLTSPPPLPRGDDQQRPVPDSPPPLPRAVVERPVPSSTDSPTEDVSPVPVGAATTALAVSERTHGGWVPLVPKSGAEGAPSAPSAAGTMAAPPVRASARCGSSGLAEHGSSPTPAAPDRGGRAADGIPPKPVIPAAVAARALADRMPGNRVISGRP